MVNILRAAVADTSSLNGRTLTIEHRVDVTETSRAESARQDGLVTLWQQAAEYRLDALGNLGECHLVAGQPGPIGLDLCAGPLDGPFEIDRSGAQRKLRSSLSLLASR